MRLSSPVFEKMFFKASNVKIKMLVENPKILFGLM